MELTLSIVNWTPASQQVHPSWMCSEEGEEVGGYEVKTLRQYIRILSTDQPGSLENIFIPPFFFFLIKRIFATMLPKLPEEFVTTSNF